MGKPVHKLLRKLRTAAAGLRVYTQGRADIGRARLYEHKSPCVSRAICEYRRRLREHEVRSNRLSSLLEPAQAQSTKQ